MNDHHVSYADLAIALRAAYAEGRKDRIEQLTRERDELRQIVFELFRVYCEVQERDGRIRYDHMCMSTYEDVQAALISWGLVKREECVRP